MAHDGLKFPSSNYYSEGMHVTVNSNENILMRGMDPKPLILDFCKPQCIYWKEKLERCEQQLEVVVKISPTKSCLYPMRDWVTCVEACVSNYQILSNSIVYRPNQRCITNQWAQSGITETLYELLVVINKEISMHFRT